MRVFQSLLGQLCSLRRFRPVPVLSLTPGATSQHLSLGLPWAPPPDALSLALRPGAWGREGLCFSVPSWRRGPQRPVPTPLPLQSEVEFLPPPVLCGFFHLALPSQVATHSNFNQDGSSISTVLHSIPVFVGPSESSEIVHLRTGSECGLRPASLHEAPVP